MASQPYDGETRGVEVADGGEKICLDRHFTGHLNEEFGVECGLETDCAHSRQTCLCLKHKRNHKSTIKPLFVSCYFLSTIPLLHTNLLDLNININQYIGFLPVPSWICLLVCTDYLVLFDLSFGTQFHYKISIMWVSKEICIMLDVPRSQSALRVMPWDWPH